MEEKIYIIYDNPNWIKNLCRELETRDLPYEKWLINENNIINLEKEPPKGIFYNIISPSSHTRGNPFAIEMTKALLAWLQQYNCTIINGLSALELETNKIMQTMALKKYNIKQNNINKDV